MKKLIIIAISLLIPFNVYAKRYYDQCNPDNNKTHQFDDVQSAYSQWTEVRLNADEIDGYPKVNTDAYNALEDGELFYYSYDSTSTVSGCQSQYIITLKLKKKNSGTTIYLRDGTTYVNLGDCNAEEMACYTDEQPPEPPPERDTQPEDDSPDSEKPERAFPAKTVYDENGNKLYEEYWIANDYGEIIDIERWGDENAMNEIKNGLRDGSIVEDTPYNNPFNDIAYDDKIIDYDDIPRVADTNINGEFPPIYYELGFNPDSTMHQTNSGDVQDYTANTDNNHTSGDNTTQSDPGIDNNQLGAVISNQNVMIANQNAQILNQRAQSTKTDVSNNLLSGIKSTNEELLMQGIHNNRNQNSSLEKQDTTNQLLSDLVSKEETSGATAQEIADAMDAKNDENLNNQKAEATSEKTLWDNLNPETLYADYDKELSETEKSNIIAPSLSEQTWFTSFLDNNAFTSALNNCRFESIDSACSMDFSIDLMGRSHTVNMSLCKYATEFQQAGDYLFGFCCLSSLFLFFRKS